MAGALRPEFRLTRAERIEHRRLMLELSPHRSRAMRRRSVFCLRSRRPRPRAVDRFAHRPGGVIRFERPRPEARVLFALRAGVESLIAAMAADVMPPRRDPDLGLDPPRPPCLLDVDSLLTAPHGPTAALVSHRAAA